ncbi:MAG: hypothetical protein JWR21_936 [Herminiimonas sp.]|nr:hypothetical protein [Herminiimonas sp.]
MRPKTQIVLSAFGVGFFSIMAVQKFNNSEDFWAAWYALLVLAHASILVDILYLKWKRTP